MKGRILVVEDNLITAEVISHLIRKLGHSVAAKLTSGEGAVEWVSQHEADLILMDVQLDGEMDGIDAAAIIRRGSQIPIVYLTANSDPHTISRAKQTQASGYLSKPVDERTLRSAVDDALVHLCSLAADQPQC